MAVLSRLNLAVLTAGVWTQFVSATRVVFMSEDGCCGTIQYMAPNVTQPIQCYNLDGYEDIPSVDVLDATPGLIVKFFSDSECQETITVADPDGGCYSNAAGSFASWSITNETSGVANTTTAANTTDLAIAEPGKIMMGNYTQMALTDPNVDLRFNFAFISAVLFGSTGIGLSIFAAVYACIAASNKEAADILACISVPLATIFGFVSGYLYRHSGAGQRINQSIELATGTINDARKRDAIDGLLHDYLGDLLPNSTHVGYMFHAQHEHPSPMYEVEPTPGFKFHVSAFIGDDGSVTHHLHSAEESEAAWADQGISKRDAPYGYNGIRWGRGGFDWNLCPYSAVSSSTLSSDPVYFYNEFYDQLTCYFPTETPYKSATAMQADMYTPDGLLIADIEIFAYGSTFSSAAPQCNSKPAPINGDCQIS